MTLNEYIKKNANNPSNNFSFLSKYAESEVFLDILTELPLKDGEFIAADENIRMTTTKMFSGNMAVFYANKNDRRLTIPFGGMLLHDAIKMVLSSSIFDGICIRSDHTAWLAVRKEVLKRNYPSCE